MNQSIKSFNHSITQLLAISLVLTCLALLPSARAVSPAPDGGYNGDNTAEGTQAAQSLTTGIWNTALGFQALFSDTTGDSNTATGLQTLFHNTDGANNTATGVLALFNNISGVSNTATGWGALYTSVFADNNTAMGVQALEHDTASDNSAFGFQALFRNSSGAFNSAFGGAALSNNTTGSQNTAIGDLAGLFLTTGSGNVDIGESVFGAAGESNITRIRNIGNTAQDTGITVTLDAVGGTKLGYVMTASSRRFKEEIKPMGNTSEALFALKPVTYHYKKQFDPDRAQRFGLIGEEVEKINPDLVAHDAQGNVTTVHYEAINAMLLNEFLKEHRKVGELQAALARQEKAVAVLAASLKTQAAQIQRVSAQLETSKPAPQVVVNP
jgi:hypothetical protein